MRTWGWQSSAHHVGLWFINPSVEYLSGGPTKFELSAHRDATFTDSLTAPAPPTLLNYWRSSHYGGAMCNIAATDTWTKVVGPFLIYCNSGITRDAVWQNALRAKKPKPPPGRSIGLPVWITRTKTNAPPFQDKSFSTIRKRPAQCSAICSSAFPLPTMRRRSFPAGAVGLAASASAAAARMIPTLSAHAGQANRIQWRLGTNSPQARHQSFRRRNEPRRSRRPRRWSVAAGGGGGGFAFRGPRIVEWQNDAKNYEFWVHGDAKGNFTIPNVRPGVYTLHAIADGVLGELAVSNVTVTAGQPLNLGNLNWQPVRYGKQLWDIGIPNRNGSEFFGGDDYFHWGWYLKYPKLFPNDVNYVVGKSDFHKDWFFEQLPHNEDLSNTNGHGPRPRHHLDGQPSNCRTRRKARPRCGWPSAA